MELGEKNGQERVTISGVAELSAVQVIVDAFAKFARTKASLPAEARQLADDTARILSDNLTLSLSVRSSTRVDGEDNFAFAPPYMGIIQIAVATFEQRPDLLTPHIPADELLGAQSFFPPTAA